MQTEFQQKLQELKKAYIESLPDLLAKIEQATKDYVDGQRDTVSMREYYRAVHSLTGSGATYGFQQISTHARALENALKPCLDESGQYPAVDLVRQLYVVLETSIKAAVDACRDVNDVQEAKVEPAPQPRVQPASMKILVADDDLYGRERLVTMLEIDGHEVFQAETGRQAVELCRQQNPDLVILDVIMPVMGGYEAARIIKQQCTRRFIPIIFLTALDNDQELVECVESGGDDFLVKSVNHTMLNAHILAMQRIVHLNRKLEEYQDEMEKEIRLTKHIFDFVTNRNPGDFPGLEVWQQPSSHFSGDMFCCNFSQQGDRYVLLGDFTGHGMHAAVGIIPVSDIFYAMSRKGMSLEDIMNEINGKLCKLLPTGRFLCAILARVNTAAGELEICNAGLPAAYVLQEHPAEPMVVDSAALPLGIVADSEYESALLKLPLQQVGTIVAFTDGITELRNQEGDMLGEESIRQVIIDSGSHSPVGGVRKLVESHRRDHAQVDDISIFSFSP